MSTTDFVIAGQSHPDGGVTVMASTSLTYAQLESKTDEVYSWYHPHPIPVNRKHVLTAEMRDYVVVYAPDYGTALRRLFDTWTPPAPARKGLPAAPAALPAPPKAVEL